MKKTRISSLAAAGAFALASFASPATALPLDELFFSQSAGWLDPVNDGSAVTGFFPGGTGLTYAGASNPTVGLPLFPANTYGKFGWNGINPGQQSFIELFSYSDSNSLTRNDVAGNPVANDADNKWKAGEYWIIDQLKQTNDVLNINPGSAVPNPLWIADTLANLRIFEDSGHSTLLKDDLNSPTQIELWETLNTGTAGDCISPNPLNTACDDIYTVLSIALAPIQFTKDGYQYTIDFALIPGATTLVCTSTLDPGCASSGVPPGEIRIFTAEDNPGTSQIYVAMAWNVRELQVPEPSIIGLFGAGLMGLGFAARRRLAGKKA